MFGRHFTPVLGRFCLCALESRKYPAYVFGDIFSGAARLRFDLLMCLAAFFSGVASMCLCAVKRSLLM